MRPQPLTALTRFGLGPKPGEIATASSDPVGYVRAQCFRPEAALIAAPYVKDRETILDLYVQVQEPVMEARRASRQGEAGGEAMFQDAVLARRDVVRDIMFGDIAARYAHGLATTAPFVERLVLFWSNHFAVDRNRGTPLRFVAGLFERDAIRPFVLGYFADMLAAAVTHPAAPRHPPGPRARPPRR